MSTNCSTTHSHAICTTFARLIQASAVTLLLALALPAHAADRAVKSRVPPAYPEMAKRMKISGSVKLQVTVDAGGSVTEVKALEGNRMLAPAAEDAVRKWKYEAGDGPSTMEVELHFNLAG
jgi:TonB family protein